jgi:ABC-type amino acid transport substrate-binding protein
MSVLKALCSRALVVSAALMMASTAQALDLRIGLGVPGALLAAPPGAAPQTPQSGGLSSFNESLARELCRRLQAHCSYHNMAFPDILPGVEARRLDLGFGNFLRTPERERRVAFSDAIWRSSSRLAGLPTGTAQLSKRLGQAPTLDTLRDVRVAVIPDTAQAAYLHALAPQQRVEVVPVRTMDQMRSVLRETRADLALMPVLSAYVLFTGDPSVPLEFVGPAYASNGLGGSVHIALPLDAGGLREQLNQAIAAMRSDGTWQRIVRQYFPFSLD